MKLDDVIDLTALQKIQDCFSKATGFAAVTVDYCGRPLLEYSGFCKFCTRLRKDPNFNERCRQSDAHGSLEAARRNDAYVYTCHAGLIDLAIPIIVEGEYIASMLCGQVRSEENTDVGANVISPSTDLFTGNPILKDEFDRVIVVPAQRIQETANLLKLTLNYIVEQYLLNQKNIKLVQDRMEKAEMEKQIKDLAFKSHHPQMNPHFLFSALNIAGRQAYLENAYKTQDMIFALADLYRCYLNCSGLLISVEQELNNLNNYIFIQKARFGEQLDFFTNIPDGIKQYSLPALSLLTLVENAVYHGLEPKEDMGKISITGAVGNGKLIFEIKDNGVGIPPQILDKLNDKSLPEKQQPEKMGTGIYYTLKRLQYFYSDAFRIQFSNIFPSGACVLLSLPVAP